MEPQAIKDLMEAPGFRDFLKALSVAAGKLKSYGAFIGVDLDSITDPVAYTVESKARKRAYDILENVILEVMNVDTKQPGATNLSDYAVMPSDGPGAPTP